MVLKLPLGMLVVGVVCEGCGGAKAALPLRGVTRPK